MKKPLVSVVVPTYNEEEYIGRLLDSLLKQDVKEPYEILIVDGMSEDRTRNIIKKYQKEHPNILLLKNPQKRTPYALNIGLNNSKGGYVTILGAHSKVPKTWLKDNYEALRKAPKEVAGVGGRLNKDSGRDRFAKATDFVTSTLIGGGSSTFRYSKKKAYTETIVFGFYKKKALEKVKGFDTTFLVGQDAELNIRLINKGYKLLFEPSIQSTYYSRSTPKKLFKQMHNYGKARMHLIQKHGLREKKTILPGIFILYVMSMIFMVPLVGTYYALPFGIYLLLILINTLRQPTTFFENMLAHLIIYAAYGWGEIEQATKNTRKNKERTL